MILRAVLFVALAGCAGIGPSGPTLRMRTIGTTSELALIKGGVVSSRLQLVETPGGYHGIVDGVEVDLLAVGRRIVGNVGEGPVNLHVDVGGRHIRLNGLFAGRFGRLTATPGAITSYIRGCTYRLHAVAERYEGWRSCGILQPVQVELPSGFDGLPPDRRAMLLVLLFGA